MLSALFIVLALLGPYLTLPLGPLGTNSWGFHSLSSRLCLVDFFGSLLRAPWNQFLGAPLHTAVFLFGSSFSSWHALGTNSWGFRKVVLHSPFEVPLNCAIFVWAPWNQFLGVLCLAFGPLGTNSWGLHRLRLELCVFVFSALFPWLSWAPWNQFLGVPLPNACP